MYSRVLQVYLIDVWNPHDYPRVIWYYLCMLNARNLNNVWYFQCNWGQYDTSRVSEGHMILYLHVRCWISEKCMMCSVYCMVIWHFKSIRVISKIPRPMQDPRPQEQRPKTKDTRPMQDPRPKTQNIRYQWQEILHVREYISNWVSYDTSSCPRVIWYTICTCLIRHLRVVQMIIWYLCTCLIVFLTWSVNLWRHNNLLTPFLECTLWRHYNQVDGLWSIFHCLKAWNQ